MGPGIDGNGHIDELICVLVKHPDSGHRFHNGDHPFFHCIGRHRCRHVAAVALVVHLLFAYDNLPHQILNIHIGFVTFPDDHDFVIGRNGSAHPIHLFGVRIPHDLEKNLIPCFRVLRQIFPVEQTPFAGTSTHIHHWKLSHMSIPLFLITGTGK